MIITLCLAICTLILAGSLLVDVSASRTFSASFSQSRRSFHNEWNCEKTRQIVNHHKPTLQLTQILHTHTLSGDYVILTEFGEKNFSSLLLVKNKWVDQSIKGINMFYFVFQHLEMAICQLSSFQQKPGVTKTGSQQLFVNRTNIVAIVQNVQMHTQVTTLPSVTQFSHALTLFTY